MKARPVFIGAGDALCAAGRGADALARACLQQPPTPSRVRVAAPGGELDLPYFRAPVDRSAMPQAIIDVAARALAQAGLDDARRAGLALFMGTSSGGMAQHEAAYANAPPGPARIPVMHPDQSSAARELHAALALGGAHYTLSSACSSAANALLYAAWMVREGLIDDALVVGLEVENRLSLQGFSSLMLTTREVSRPFDAARDGIVLGECVAALVLSHRPLPGARSWRLLGGGTLCDAGHPTNASSGKIGGTVRSALADAGVAAQDIVAIKAHGTGTRSNDQAEGLALLDVFGDRMPPLTSIKPAFGHTLGACGALETAALMACLDRGYFPPTPNFRTADPELNLRPAAERLQIPNGPVVLNYFGFGGNNCSLVIAPDER